MLKITPHKIHELFAEWMKSVIPVIKGVVAIDGKQARRTGDNTKRPLHVVSAFAHEYGMVIGQLACEEKSNEITAIPKLLDLLEIKGCIVTIDATGTQTEIAKKIREKGADYILSLRSNQLNLYNDVKLFMNEYCKDAKAKSDEIYACTVNRKASFERRIRFQNVVCDMTDSIEIFGRIILPCSAFIFSERHIEHPMQCIFNAPMISFCLHTYPILDAFDS